MPVANYTIDDSQWSTSALSLTEGWNMLRQGGANEYINEEEVESMRPLLGEFWNSSVSWTTTPGSATTLSFVGTDIWAFGMAGPNGGGYTASLDNKTIGTYTSHSDIADYKRLLFAAHDLKDGERHTLVLRNEEGGGALIFDYAIVQGEAVASSPSSSASPSQTPPAGLAVLLNSTSAVPSGNAESPLAGLGNLTSAGQAAGITPPKVYSPQQLALLSQQYTFKWNPSAYFVVVFSCLVAVIFTGLIGYYLFFVSNGCKRDKKFPMVKRFKGRGDARKTEEGEGSVRDGESYLITGRERPRPNTRLLDALRKGNISAPVPSDAGMSNKRSSYGTGESWLGERGRGNDNW